MKILFYLFILFISLFANEKVSLQLQWYDQFQFAGYYIAKEKGFYKDVGLEVEIKKFKPELDITKEVIEGKATFGIGRTSLIIDKSRGNDIVLLAAILQSSPLVLISKKSSGINTIEDFKGKRVMLTGTKTSAGIFGMLSSHGITNKDMKILPNENKMKNFLENKVDIISAYTSNQVHTLRQNGIEINVFNPKDFGFDFYSDILFTSEKEYKEHNLRVLNFTKASLKGWEYAFNHIEEAVQLILKKYNTQNKTESQLFYEAMKLKELAYKNTDKLGKIQREKIKQIYDIYKIMGFIKNSINLDEMIADTDKKYFYLTPKEKSWLKNHPIVTYSEVNWKPLSIIENNRMRGIFGDFLDLISKKTGIKFRYIPSKSWDKVIEKFKNQTIDMIPSNPQDIHNLGLVSKVYKTYPMVIVTDERYKYVSDLNDLKGKTIAVPKYYTSYNYLIKNYPDIKILATKNISQALTLLQEKKADAFIGHIATSIYHISLLNFTNLKIAGTTNFEFKHAYLIQRKYPELLSIINKGFDLITEAERAKIYSKWSTINLKQKIDYKLIANIILFASVILLFLSYRNRKLKQYNKEIKELKERLELALIGSNEGLWDRDFTNNRVYRSPRWKEIIGYKDYELPNRVEEWSDRVHPDDLPKALKDIQDHLYGKTEFYNNIHRIKHKDGHWVWVHDRGKKIEDNNSKIVRMLGTCTDITKDKEVELKIKHQQQIIEQIHDCVISTDLKGYITSWNRGAEKLLEYKKEEIIGKHIDTIYSLYTRNKIRELFKILKKKEKIQTELKLLKKSQEEIFTESTISIFQDENNNIIGMIGYVKDITKRKKVEEELKKHEEILRYQANYDLLTGLPNRVLFNDRLNQSIEKAKRHNEKFALFFLDLDRFKQINDSLGHEIGDEVLKVISKKIESILRKEDTLARLGGDEFVIITGSIKEHKDIGKLAKKIINILKDPVIINNQKLYISVSIGISLFPNDSQIAKNLLKYADSAMYKAKEEGRDNYQFYSEEMTKIAYEKVELETNLRLAIKNDEFVVYYQPQIDAINNKLVGMEALVRWQSPTKGLISPAKFIPIALETGMILDIDKIVMKKAMKQISQWNKEGLKTGILALNLSMEHLNDKNLIDVIKRHLHRYNFKANQLELEVTENKVMKNPEEMILKLKKLNEMGIKVAIDDFGTGYSSLSYLKRLPISTLKIDQSFIRFVTQNEEDASIVKAIIALAKSLNLELIGEGIETKEQKDFIVQSGCNVIQGYYYSKPLSAKDMKEFIKSYIR